MDQQLDLLSRLVNSERTIDEITSGKVNHWLVCLVVSDPFPSLEALLTPLKDLMKQLPETNAQYHGPFVVSLEELEYIETLSVNNKVSQILIDWEGSTHAGEPFEQYFYARTRGREVNRWVEKRTNEALTQVERRLFPNG